MAVIIGSARCDELGHIHGGKAGSQSPKEVSTQDWYKHSKGWIVIRAKSDEAAEKIAICMEKACESPRIGYDQWQRNTLWNAVKNHGYDPDALTFDVETDCSALVRVCCAYAGIVVDDCNTTTLPGRLKATGEFEIFTSTKYTESSAYLRRGDILCTRTKGHVVVVLSDGAKIAKPQPYQGPLSLPAKGYIELRDTGIYVARLQKFLNWFGNYHLDVDEIFGIKTDTAVRRFQKAVGIEVDGVFGKISLKKAKAVKK